MINIDLRRYDTDKEYHKFVNGLVSGADIDEEPMEIMIEKDNINPDHYKNSTSLECIEAMLLVFGKRAVVNFCECNAWKYIWRWKHKNGYEDLEKARWYIEKAVELDPTNYSVLLERMRDYIEVNNCPEQDGDK